MTRFRYSRGASHFHDALQKIAVQQGSFDQSHSPHGVPPLEMSPDYGQILMKAGERLLFHTTTYRRKEDFVSLDDLTGEQDLFGIEEIDHDGNGSFIYHRRELRFQYRAGPDYGKLQHFYDFTAWY